MYALKGLLLFLAAAGVCGFVPASPSVPARRAEVSMAAKKATAVAGKKVSVRTYVPMCVVVCVTCVRYSGLLTRARTWKG
jgi:hypothetical protein